MSVTVSRMWATEFAVIGMPAMLPCAPCQNPVVQIGMTMPVMEPNLDAATLTSWARVIDGRPVRVAVLGRADRNSTNPDSLDAAFRSAGGADRSGAPGDDRDRPQLHDPVMLAKALAKGDLLSGGRLTVGLGLGGRDEDYLAVGADPATQTMRDMADRVAIMKRVWAGEKITESVLPVGPSPVQSGGPQLLVGTIDPRPCAARRPGPRDSPASPSTSTSTSRTSCTTSLAWPGRGGQAQAAFGDVLLVRARRPRGGPRPGAPPPPPLHELDSRRIRRRDGTHDRGGGHRREAARGAAPVRGPSAPTKCT